MSTSDLTNHSAVVRKALHVILWGWLLACGVATGALARDHGDDGDWHHDNGKHKGWYKHHDRDDYDDWDYDGERIRPGHYYPQGRYPYIRHVIVVRGFDPRTRHIILYDQSNWVVAPYDVPRCHDWEWDRDRVYVYDDDRHPGWYVLFNSRLGRSVHVEFFGM
jgi:hypothetical protein